MVVPGFGVFSLKYIPAGIHTAKQTFEPPSKEILFTSAVKDDTGALIKYISEKEDLKEKDVQAQLEDFVNDCNTKLANGDELDLIKLGKISRKPDGSYIFKADKSVNYFNETFGVESFDAPKPIIDRDNKDHILEEKTKKTVIKRKKRKVILYLSLLIPLAAIIVLGIFNYNIIKNKIKGYHKESLETEQNKADRSSQEKLMEEHSKDQKLFDTIQDKKTKADSTIAQDSMKALETDVNDQKISGEEEKVSEPGKKYYIVAGSFRLEENAEKLMKKLQAKGYNSEIFGTTSHGLVMVSYEAFVAKNDALTELKRITREENPNAWLIEY